MVTNKWIWSGWIYKVRIGHSRSVQIALMARRNVSAISPVSIRLQYFGHHIIWYAVWYTQLRLYTISTMSIILSHSNVKCMGRNSSPDSILWLRYPNYLAEPLNGYAGYKCVVHVIKSDVSLRHFYEASSSPFFRRVPWHLTTSVCFADKKAACRLRVAATLKTVAFLTQTVVSSLRTTRRKKNFSVASAASAFPPS